MHAEESKSRIARDHKDTFTISNFLSSRSPFQGDESLRSIITGKEAEKDVHVDEAKKIGENFIAANCSHAVSDVVFQKANQATIMSSKSTALKMGDEVVHVDSQLLFKND